MNVKFQNKYRITSPRLKNWNYANSGLYFVTICTKARIHFFGEIHNNRNSLSGIGEIAEKLWLQISTYFSSVILHDYVIMPNHLHGLIEIGRKLNLVDSRDSTINSKNPHSRFQNQGRSTLSSIIGSYKSSVTKEARKINCAFYWQASFHEHIVRNEKSLYYIQAYIQSNVKNWPLDELYCI